MTTIRESSPVIAGWFWQVAAGGQGLPGAGSVVTGVLSGYSSSPLSIIVTSTAANTALAFGLRARARFGVAEPARFPRDDH